jgi:hypothetical protein
MFLTTLPPQNPPYLSAPIQKHHGKLAPQAQDTDKALRRTDECLVRL